MMVISDMTEMAQFVYDFYKHKLSELMSRHGVSQQPRGLREAGEVSQASRPQEQPGGGMEQHPGAESGSEDEAE